MDDSYQKFRVDRIVIESWNTKSYFLVPSDGSATKPYTPGQHLLLRLSVDLEDPQLKILRFYTLSDCYRAGEAYRITVKHETAPEEHLPSGAGSTYLHSHISVGDQIEAKGPMGDFTLNTDDSSPIVLIAAGIGITPILAMAQAMAAHASNQRSIHIFIGMTNGKHYPFKEELAELAKNAPTIRLHISYSQPTGDDVVGVDYHEQGRLSVDTLKRALPDSHQQYYICGPSSMMDDLTNGLADWGVGENQMFTESFGPSTATKSVASEQADTSQTGDDPATVSFSKSNQSIQWDARYNNLLEFAEANGISINAGCLYGDCGICITNLQAGEVNYNHPTEIIPEVGSCLPCSCKPKGSISLNA